MSGIYVHIPFCKKRCSYCNFYSTTLLSHIDKYVGCICDEAAAKKDFLNNNPVKTIYFGGGTPSLLNYEQINRIYNTLVSFYNTENLNEFTIECNPDDLNAEYIEELKKTAINRISIGIQSFDDRLLEFINRRHTSNAAINAVKMLKNSGFDNISIDLIYGIPGQSEESWKESVRQAIELDVQHISAYNLSFEEEAPIYKYIDSAPDDDTCLNMYKYLCSQLFNAGFEHYEISNFAKKSFRSQHNNSYWTGYTYLGLGAGAHSYDGKRRFWNKDIQLIGNTLKWETENEYLSEKDIFNELIITSLRTKEGVSTEKIDKKFINHFYKIADKYISERLLKSDNEWVSLTEKGIFISDSIIRDFIIL